MALLFEKESYDIRGAALEVHKELGCGFSEKVYQDALEVEFKKRGIPYEREKRLIVQYKGVTLSHDFYSDFVCYDKIIVELKAVEKLLPIHKAQVINYLKVSGMQVGLCSISVKPLWRQKDYFAINNENYEYNKRIYIII